MNRHGESGQADHSINDVNDFENIIDVLKNYDSITLTKEKSNFRNGQGENAPIILYAKQLDNNTLFVAETVTDGKKRKLRIISAYKSKLQKKVLCLTVDVLNESHIEVREPLLIALLIIIRHFS